jgi:hypothetical protein
LWEEVVSLESIQWATPDKEKAISILMSNVLPVLVLYLPQLINLVIAKTKCTKQLIALAASTSTPNDPKKFVEEVTSLFMDANAAQVEMTLSLLLPAAQLDVSSSATITEESFVSAIQSSLNIWKPLRRPP